MASMKRPASAIASASPAAEEASSAADSAVPPPPPPHTEGKVWRAKNGRIAGYGREEHGGPFKPFQFIQMADTQLGMESVWTGVRPKTWDHEIHLMKRAVEEVNRLQPAFAIICGDLLDDIPKEDPTCPYKDPAVREEQERDFMEIVKGVDPKIPLLCLCGNHDVGNRPNSITLKKWEKSFGEDYFSFWFNGVKCLIVNTQLWKDDTDAKAEREAMDKWLDKELEETDHILSQELNGGDGKRARTVRPILIFSHIPPFVFDQNERNGYFNIEKELRNNLLGRLAERGAVGWFCGHYHRNVLAKYTHKSGEEVEIIVTSAVGVQIRDNLDGDPLEVSGQGEWVLGEDLSGFRIVDVLADGSLDHKWRTFAQLREEAKAEASSK